MTPQLSVFLACSLDGYIAAPDGSLDWLDDAVGEGEDYGYDAFMATVDALAMGRGTYDHIAHIDPLPFGDRPLYVFTHRDPGPRDGVTFWARTPQEAVAQWSAEGHRRVYVDGGRLISAFLDAGLVDDLLVTLVPRLLGDGRPLFHPIGRGAPLRLTGVEQFPSGMVNLSYERMRPDVEA